MANGPNIFHMLLVNFSTGVNCCNCAASEWQSSRYTDRPGVHLDCGGSGSGVDVTRHKQYGKLTSGATHRLQRCG